MSLKTALNTCPYCQKTFSLRGMPNHIKFKHPDELPKKAILTEQPEEQTEIPEQLAEIPELEPLPEQIEPQPEQGEIEMSEIETATGEVIKIIKENPVQAAAGTAAAAVVAPSVFEMAAEKFVQMPEAGQLVQAVAGLAEAMTARLAGKTAGDKKGNGGVSYDGIPDF